jgi:predicted dehydrogenase
MPPVRVVILGSSFGVTVHAAGFRRHPGFVVVGLAGSDASARAVAPPSTASPKADDDWRRLLVRTRPDLVAVVTPVDLHHPMALAALDQGAHVLCEKPTALDRRQAEDMRDRARAAGRVLAINHEFRFFPARRLAVELVRRAPSACRAAATSWAATHSGRGRRRAR